jgi:PcfJ-like protein
VTCQTAIFDLSPVLHYPIKLSVNRWDSERPLHWSSFNEEGIVAEGQFLAAPGLPLFTLEDDEGNRLSDSMPPELSRIAQLMPAMDFELAQACAVSDAARELALDSPLLFLFVVALARRESLSIDEFERLLSLKRPEILQRLGFPGTKSLARLMRRIELSPLLPWELEDIATVLRNPAFLALLRHHPVLHLNHLRLLLRRQVPLWPGILHLVDKHSSALDIAWVARMTRDTLNMAGRNERVLEGIASREAIQTLHDRLVQQFNREHGKDPEATRAALAAQLQLEHGDYPAPPLAAIDGIEPLNSWLALLEEGATMHHCVGSYDIPVALREVFIYRMLEPERLTISLEHHNDRWVVGEVRGYCNANPSVGALESVRRWVER